MAGVFSCSYFIERDFFRNWIEKQEERIMDFQQQTPQGMPNGAPVPPTSPVKPAKNKKKFSFGTVVTVAIVCSLICGILSSGIVLLTVGTLSGKVTPSKDETSSVVQAPTQQIEIKDSTTDVAAGVAEKVSNSVVGIRITFPYQNFFSQSTATSEGSGVIYTADGYIITNYHVIENAVADSSYGTIAPGATIEVYLANDIETGVPAQVVGYDSGADLAVLKIEKSGLMPIEIGNSDELIIGEKAIAIGSPGGLEFMGSVSQGIISGLNRTIATESGVQMHMVQTDAAINPGNSGGALVDSEGKLIGINNVKLSGDGFEGMCFAIPVNEVVEITDRIISKEDMDFGYLGIAINTKYTAEILDRMGYPAGVVVYSVDEDSPADKAGIEAGDIITKLNDVEVSSYAAMVSERNKYGAGDTITVTIFRGGRTTTVEVTLAVSA